MTFFISPSQKDYKISQITGISEKESMMQLAKAIEENLISDGNIVIINEGLSPSEAAESAKDKKVDLYLSLSFLNAPSADEKGIVIYYNSADARSRDHAQRLAENLKQIYPSPELLTTQPNGSFVELTASESPAIALFIGNHSNESDALWFSENLGDIANIISESISPSQSQDDFSPLTEYGIISSPNGYTAVRKSPSPTARIITRIQNGTPVKIIGNIKNWYAIIASRSEGYVIQNDVNLIYTDNA